MDDYEIMMIDKAKLKIEKSVELHGLENTCISFSGGKDSTVLRHLVKSLYPDIKSIFCNTGVEYDLIVDFVKSFSDVEIIKPKKSFVEVVRKFGFPAISKEQSRFIGDIQNDKVSKKTKDLRLAGGNFSIHKKWKWILDTTDIFLSDKCCYYLKKYPLQRLKYYYFTGERISESNLRRQRYHTCILPKKCIPLRLWKDELIDKYIEHYGLELCSIYNYERRTGCKFCLYGVHLEKRPNRIDRLKFIEPKSYEFAVKLGIVDLMERILKGAV